MFEKLFVKYARAVSNEQERRKLYRLFCARTISEIIFLAVCVAVIFEALFYSDAIDAAQISDWQFIMLGVTLALWLVSGIVALVLWLTFRSAYKKILDRPDSASEMPEVASYRRKTREGSASAKKSLRWAAVVLAAGIVAMIAMVVADFVLNPEAEGLGILSYAGIGVFAVCLFIFLLALSFSQFKKTAEGDTVEMRTAGEARAIDLVQGREHKYSLQEDKNAQTYRFLFPDDDLFRKAEDVRKKQVKISVYAAVIFCVIGVVVAVLFFLPQVFGQNLSGYAYPVFLTILAVGVFAATLPCVLQLVRLEKQQKIQLESNPAYAKNLAIYRKYEQFFKVKGKVMIICLLLSVIVGYVLAALFPDAAWSVFAVILIFAGAFINNKFVTDLRKEVRPIEDEIERERRLAQESAPANQGTIDADEEGGNGAE